MSATQMNEEKFSWKINPKVAKQTIYSKQKCVERVDINQIYGFINAEMGITYEGAQHTRWGNEMKQVQEYKNRYSKKTRLFHIQHKLAKHKWGRTQPVGFASMSVFHRPTRHALCEAKYKDIDMENAQVNIIKEVALQHEVGCPSLEKYCENPKKYRAKIMEHHKCSKDVAKKLVISIMYGGKYSSWLTKNDIQKNDNNPLKIAVGIQEEIIPIMEIVYVANSKIRDDVLKADPLHWESEAEKKRGVMALWGQTIEKMIQETAILFLSQNEERDIALTDIIPCQDGFMILKEDYYDEICDELTHVVRELFNINMKWVEKPFDEAIDIPSYTEISTYDEWEDLLSVKKLGDRFIEDYGDYIVRNDNNIYTYWGGDSINGEILNGRWYDETNERKRYKLILYISEDLQKLLAADLNAAIELDEETELPKLMKLLRQRTSAMFSIKDIITHILTKARQTEEAFDSNPYLIGFENGVYDLMRDEIRDYKFDDYITISTNYNFSPLSELDPLKIKLLDEIIESIHPDEEHRLLYLQVLASGLDGRAYQKLFLFNGGGGNGKGLTGGLMGAILGEYYLQPSNGLLKDVERSNAPSPDMYNLKNKRYINFKEVAGAIRVAMLRNLTGGGSFVGRLLNQNPEIFFMMATFVMEFNNAPELDGKPQRADIRRLVDLYFPKTYTDDPNKVGKTIGGIQYVEANTEYETQQFFNKMRDVFLHKLLGIYREHKTKDGIKFNIPQSVRDRTDEFIANQNLFQKVFNDVFVKVQPLPNNKKDERSKTMMLKDIFSEIVYSNDYKLLSHREKRQYNAKSFEEWIGEQFKIITNTKGKKIIGVMRKVEDVESDTETEVAFGDCMI
tara:strand:+ start:681 stop:3227 length:2547 start_codon:yes stop_codon:yes gene_type:complete